MQALLQTYFQKPWAVRQVGENVVQEDWNLRLILEREVVVGWKDPLAPGGPPDATVALKERRFTPLEEPARPDGMPGGER